MNQQEQQRAGVGVGETACVRAPMRVCVYVCQCTGDEWDWKRKLTALRDRGYIHTHTNTHTQARTTPFLIHAVEREEVNI